MKPSSVLIRTACLGAAVIAGKLAASPAILIAPLEAHAPAAWPADGVSTELIARLVLMLGLWAVGLSLALPWMVICSSLRGFNPGPNGPHEATGSFNRLIAVARIRDYLAFALIAASAFSYEVTAGDGLVDRWAPVIVSLGLAVHLLGLYRHQDAHAGFTRMMFDVFDRMLPGNRDRRL